MVIDTSDNFYTNTSSNSLRLYQTLKHEHGHGMGLLHVCPLEDEKLMEPQITFAFQGAQHDDIRGAHRLYGDFFEPNDSITVIENAIAAGDAPASDFGVLAIGDVRNAGNLPPNGRASVAFGSRASINHAG